MKQLTKTILHYFGYDVKPQARGYRPGDLYRFYSGLNWSLAAGQLVGV